MKNTISALVAFSLTATLAFSHPNHDGKPGKAPTTATQTGNGIHTYMTVPHWGDIPDGKPLGPTHGGVAVSKAGDVYVSTSSDRAICVFSPEGKFLKSIAPDCTDVHSLSIHQENGSEYLYGAHKNGQRIVKLTLDGALVLEIKDTESQPIPGTLKGLTAVTVAPDGRIFAAVGYGSNQIHVFDQSGKLLQSFGSKGKELEEFHTCHGLAIDTRFDETRLLVVDRENRRLTHYDLSGKLIGVHSTHLRRPCAVSFHGEFVAVAELQGRVTIVNKSGAPVAFLGDNPNQDQWAKFKTLPADIPEGIFTAPHGLSYDADANLYVQDWNQTGRITKLVRVH
ncbi:MAG: 6-bladed beta-propeller [Verrucomicrobiota bacterium]